MSKLIGNAIFGQSGGPTSVINASAAGVFTEALKQTGVIEKVYGAANGIVGILNEKFYDIGQEDPAELELLKTTPSSALGSCRYKLAKPEVDDTDYKRILEVFKKYNIRYFFYNGGNDSMDTAWKVSQIAEALGYPVVCVGIPKTVDNDLPLTDCCPGFGSVAKYVATAMREAGYDVASMARTSTKVFVMEVMGRHAGWITAACGLASEAEGAPPHLLLFPERPFDPEAFLVQVESCVQRHGYCTIAVSEGLSDANGRLIAEGATRDAFGHAQLGGVGQVVAQLIQDRLGYKYHWALPDYLQRAGRHLASATDLAQAYALGAAAVDLALAGKNAVMATIERLSDAPYRWQIGEAPLSAVANVERKMPAEFIRDDGFHITPACRRYLLPLIEGEAPPPFRDGLPDYVRLKNIAIRKKLAAFTI